MMDKQRTATQNSALHLWFELIAETLNDAGYEQALTIGTVDVPWSKESVKWMFRKIGKAQFEQPKTSLMTTKQLQGVVETLTRILAQKGIKHVPFPSYEEVLFQQDNNL